MPVIRFTAYGEPKAKGRPRFFRRGQFVGTYTPKETVAAENDLRLQALKFKPKKPLEGPIGLEMHIYKPVPKSFSKKKLEGIADGTVRPITRPDWDNYAKLVCDALNGVYWRDDSQIIWAYIEKKYDAVPRIEVKVEYLEGDELYK